MHETLRVGHLVLIFHHRSDQCCNEEQDFTSSLDVIGVVGFGTTNKVPETLDFNNISEICPANIHAGTTSWTLEKLSVGETDSPRAVNGGGHQAQRGPRTALPVLITTEVGGKVGSLAGYSSVNLQR